jgi:hypothetical protein
VPEAESEQELETSPSPSVDWRQNSNREAHQINVADAPADVLIVRRSAAFDLSIQHPDGVAAGRVSATITGVHGAWSLHVPVVAGKCCLD